MPAQCKSINACSDVHTCKMTVKAALVKGGQLADTFRDGVVLVKWGPSHGGAVPPDKEDTSKALRWLSKLQQADIGLTEQLELLFSFDKQQVCCACNLPGSLRCITSNGKYWLDSIPVMPI